MECWARRLHRGGAERGVNEFLIKRFSELCELCAVIFESFCSLRKLSGSPIVNISDSSPQRR